MEKSRLGVLPEMLSQVFDKNVGAQPIKIAGVLGSERLVARCSRLGKIGQRLSSNFGWLCCSGLIRAEQRAVTVVIVVASIEQGGVLRAYGQRQAFLQGVEVDIIAQDVATHRKQERMTAAFQSLKQISAAEPDETLAGAREIVHYFGFFLRRWHIERGL